MQFHGAKITEQGITFAIVVVKPHILTTTSSCDDARNAFSIHFPGIPLILMAQNASGTPRYQGRTDIVKFLANIDPRRIPFRTYTI